MKAKYLLIPFALGLGLALVWVLGGMDGTVVAAPHAERGIEIPNAPAAELHVCPSGCTYSSIQDAVDAAADGDVIKVAAGTYTGVSARPAPPSYENPPTSGLITQVVYISKTVTIRGGYTTAFADLPDPEANPTTLNAQGRGRVLLIAGEITPVIESLRITAGDAAGLGGIRWSGEGLGGGVYVLTATATISDNRVFGNSAGRGGGVFLSGSDVTLSGNTISGNTANDGGGGGLYSMEGDATVSGNIISGNFAESGGGLYLRDSDATLNGNTITDNTANRLGGGLYLSGSDATLNGNTISGNTAGSGGGGLLLTWSNATLINNAITDNQTDYLGCGLYIARSSPRLLHTTIARNCASGGSGDGSGVYVAEETWKTPYYYTVAMTNTILSGHTVGIYVGWYMTATLESTLWNGNTTNRSGAGTIHHDNDYTGDPAFVDPDAGDYHIGPGSAAIDMGVDSGGDHDMDGDPRPLGNGYDLGADETGVVVTKWAIPDPVELGAPLTYTIHMTNVTATDLHATITDTLPLSVTLDQTAGGTLVLPGGTAVLPNGTVAITWTGIITAPGGTWMGTVLVTVDEDYVGPLTNLVEVTTEEGIAGTASVTVSTGSYVYLPLVLRDLP